MGFTAGFLGGVTLTASVLYLGASIHRSNRTYQSTLVSQQSRVLTNLIDGTPPPPRDQLKKVPAGVLEMGKDKWNSEIEGLVKRAYETNWAAVRARWEDRVAAAWGGLRKQFKEADDNK